MNKMNEDIVSVFSRWIYLGDIEKIKEHILSHREDAFLMTERDNRTFIHICAEYNQVECLKLFLENGVDINHKSVFCRTALLVAAAHGSLEAFKFLVDAGLSSDETDKFKWNALHHAVNSDSLGMVKYLVDINPALLYRSNNAGSTPIGVAKAYGHFEIADFLASYAEESRLSKNVDTGDVETGFVF